jgi:hypothetical protein
MRSRSAIQPVTHDRLPAPPVHGDIETAIIALRLAEALSSCAPTLGRGGRLRGHGRDRLGDAGGRGARARH